MRAGERRPARDHLVKHRADGKEVRRRIELFAAKLLRRHVADRAEDPPAGQVLHRCGALGGGFRANAFARPKSSSFGAPSGVTMMFSGLMSR